MELQELRDLLRSAGVVGAGGAGFPTYGKLTDAADTIILNCAECEPLLKLHRQLLEAYTDEILEALSVIVKATGAARGIVAVKAHYTGAVEAVRAALPDHPDLTLHTLPSVYPMGDEIILIQEVTGRTVPPGSLPASVGVTVCNVETVYNVFRAMEGSPVTDKYVTVAGEVANPVTLCVPLGTPFSALVRAAGGAIREDVAYLVGGPMMGGIGTSLDVVTKTTNAVILLPKDHPVILQKQQNTQINLRRAMSVCCQCRSCTELCSRHVAGYPVEPHMVMRVLSNGGRGDTLRLSGSLFCSGCGLCESYSCPQGLSPRALIAAMKDAARQQGIRPTPVPAEEVAADAAYHKVSLARLTTRLGLSVYDVPAPVQPAPAIRAVKIPLSQHIGAPARPVVSVGDIVQKGDCIAEAAAGALSVSIHASLSGRVAAVGDRYIKINA